MWRKLVFATAARERRPPYFEMQKLSPASFGRATIDDANFCSALQGSLCSIMVRAHPS
jgi:hypothetical protein